MKPRALFWNCHQHLHVIYASVLLNSKLNVFAFNDFKTMIQFLHLDVQVITNLCRFYINDVVLLIDSENVLYLSLHFNESKSDSAQGIELYLSEQEDVNQLKSKLYGEIFGQLAVAKDIQFRGVKTAGFYVVKNSNSPAILMELGFMSSPEELEKILDDQYRKKVCSVIAESTNLYVN